jgi:hypothetical protein
MVSRDGQPAARIAGGGGLESAHVVALPAMDGNRVSGEDFEGFFGIHAERGVGLTRNFVGGGHN